MRFATPLALVLLLAIPYIVWVAWARQSYRSWRRSASLALRVAIMALLTLALAGAQAVRAADELAVVFLVDGSDSITFEQAQQAETLIRDAMAQMVANDRAAVIVFGGNALVDRPMSALSDLAPISSVPQTLQTDLAEAIRLGLALFPAESGRRMVVLSDGAANVGNAEEAARLAAVSGVTIDFVSLIRSGTPAEAWLLNVDVPTRVSEGEIFTVAVSAESTTNQPATLRIISGGNIVAEQAVNLSVGVNNYTIRIEAGEQEFTRFAVELIAANDTYIQNNQLGAFTEVVGAPKVLIVSADGSLDENNRPVLDESPQLRLALTAVGLDVETVTPQGLSADLAQLSNYASIVLVNVNAKNLSPRKMDALQTYVRDLGGGLIAVGGPNSYGMGGYFQTPLEAALPVEMQIKDSERFPAVSIAIVIDRSGSMGVEENGISKIQLAAQGAARVVELLNDNDEITIITVDEQPDTTIGPYLATERETVIGQLRQLGAGGGGIFVRNGMQAAANALAETANPVKHIIVLADGSDSEQKEGVPDLIDTLVADGVTVSMVAIGEGKDVAWLREMAERGNGRFHLTDRAANLPQIFTQETTNIQRSYVIEERFFPELVSNSPILSGIDAIPPLYGYVGTSPKATAQVVLRSTMEDPVLAQWQYGLGRSVAWTSDATGRWATDWVRWPAFPTFWAQAVRWTIAQNRESTVESAITLDGESADLTVDVRNTAGTFLDGLTMEANVVAPDGEVENVVLQQVAPGRYSADFTPTSEGAYLVRIAGADETEETVVGQTTGWVLGYSPEYQQFDPNPNLLSTIAEMTGGRDVSADPTAIFLHDVEASRAIRPIWHLLTFIALLLLPLDIAVRRLVITQSDLARAYEWAFGRFRSTQPIPQPRTEQASRLFEAKQRAVSKQQTAISNVAGHDPTVQPVADNNQQPATSNKPPNMKDAPPTTHHASPLASRLLAKKRQQQRD